MKDIIYKCDACKNKLNGSAIKAVVSVGASFPHRSIGIAPVKDTEYENADLLFCNFICLARYFEKEFGLPHGETK